MTWELILENKFSDKFVKVFASFYFVFFLEELNIFQPFLSKIFIYCTYCIM